MDDKLLIRAKNENAVDKVLLEQSTIFVIPVRFGCERFFLSHHGVKA